MTSLSTPSVLLVHGAGLDATSFDEFAARLRRSGFDPQAITRRGYDGSDPAPALGDHVDEIVGLLDSRPPESVIVVGVSGGATLGLMLALRGHPSLIAVIVHEPLLGKAAAEQHAVISSSIGTFLADRSPGAYAAFLERLVTPVGWHRLPEDVRRQALHHEVVVRSEAPSFANYAVDIDQMAHSPTRIVWTVGAKSPSWRHDAAEVGRRLGCEIQTLDCRHTPQLEDPTGLLAALRSLGHRS